MLIAAIVITLIFITFRNKLKNKLNSCCRYLCCEVKSVHMRPVWTWSVTECRINQAYNETFQNAQISILSRKISNCFKSSILLRETPLAPRAPPTYYAASNTASKNNERRESIIAPAHSYCHRGIPTYRLHTCTSNIVARQFIHNAILFRM